MKKLTDAQSQETLSDAELAQVCGGQQEPERNEQGQLVGPVWVTPPYDQNDPRTYIFFD